MNAAKVTKVIDVTGGTATIRKLSGRHLERARESRTAQRWDAYRKLMAFQREFAPVTAEKTPEKAPVSDAPVVPVNPLDDYDPYVLIECGLVEVSSGDAVTPEFVSDLAEEDVLDLAEKILRLTVPTLFLSPEGVEAAQKNG